MVLEYDACAQNLRDMGRRQQERHDQDRQALHILGQVLAHIDRQLIYEAGFACPYPSEKIDAVIDHAQQVLPKGGTS